ncbi:MAG TPA: IPT/TIG domain-containing protein [Bryobacteraceae bacterium]|nr:IPT/TIG domain-containing protein [Bryobacteraceae bacterium]
MVKNIFSVSCSGILILLGLSATASAAPRLSLSQTAFTVSVAPGANGPSKTVDAGNLGDGSLSLSVASSVTWLSPSVGAAHPCSGGTGTCVPVQIALLTASLAKGTFTGRVTLSDPNAIDAPQFVTVTVQVGGAVPDKVEYFLPPGGAASTSFITASTVNTTVSNSPWLSVALDGVGTFLFNVPYKLNVSAATNMATGDYNGSVALAGSSFPPDNKTVSVLLHVTTQPILQTNSNNVQFSIAAGAKKQTGFVGIANGGQGTLTISSVTATAATGSWLSAQSISNGTLIQITADPTGLSPNTYTGTVTVASNAANPSVTISVQLVVEPQTAPVVFAGGVVNNGTFGGGEALAQGDIVAVFGDQFTANDPTGAPGLPLPTTLSDTQVLVNGVPAPVYFTSPGQVNFQIPIDATVGKGTVSVSRNGQVGNQAFVTITDRAPRFLLLPGNFAIMTTATGTLTGNSSNPVKAGDVVVIYTIGLGPTTPVVPSGTASPGSPLAIVPTTKACYGFSTPFSQAPCTDVGFAGLTPAFVGLYQINTTIPTGLGSGNIPFSFTVNGVQSNFVQLAVQ